MGLCFRKKASTIVDGKLVLSENYVKYEIVMRD